MVVSKEESGEVKHVTFFTPEKLWSENVVWGNLPVLELIGSTLMDC